MTGTNHYYPNVVRADWFPIVFREAITNQQITLKSLWWNYAVAVTVPGLTEILALPVVIIMVKYPLF